jgi:oligopeptide/dipeptide ABC transporter ATP-binding protein
MYRGRLMEEASARELAETRLHPYTRLLYDSIPSRMDASAAVPDYEPFDSTKPLEGCPFYHRCPKRQEKCLTETPVFRELRPGHKAACHFPEFG